MMTPPRKPRGESPKITVRLLRRQLGIAQATIAALQMGRADKEKVIAGYDVQLEEIDRELMRTQNTVADQAWRIGDLEQRLRLKSERLAFLEGYYAAHHETLPRPISAAGTPFPRNPAQAQTGGRSGDQENLSAGRQRSQGAGLDQGAAGFGSGLSDSIWRQHPHDRSNPEECQVEHIEINDGISRERFSLRNRGD